MKRFSTPAQFIREHVFGVRTQVEFAAMLGCTQATISRAESEGFSTDMQERVRALAKEKQLPWDSDWLFEVPKEFASKPETEEAA